MNLILSIINTLMSLLILLVFLYALLSFFIRPYHPIRVLLERIVEPMLAPIRRIIPPYSGVDFSPLILIIILRVVGMLLGAILRSFG